MARKRERVFAGFFAALFLITSSALAIVAIYASHQSNSSTSSAENAAANQSKEKTMQNKLQGTKLANFTPVASVSALQATDITPGTGATVKAGDTVTVDYTGALASTGVIFQSSKDSGQTVPIDLKQVIAGWSQGIPGMKVGGTRQLLIPAALGYGSQAQTGIPANSDLVFDVTVHKIGQ